LNSDPTLAAIDPINSRGGSMKIALLAILAVMALSTTGCVSSGVIVSTEKQAYVMKGSFLGTSMYHCKADGPKPVCTQVEEVE
jgi:hypothetical protein